jgi:hypothetical protein
MPLIPHGFCWIPNRPCLSSVTRSFSPTSGLLPIQSVPSVTAVPKPHLSLANFTTLDSRAPPGTIWSPLQTYSLWLESDAYVASPWTHPHPLPSLSIHLMAPFSLLTNILLTCMYTHRPILSHNQVSSIFCPQWLPTKHSSHPGKFNKPMQPDVYIACWAVLVKNCFNKS